MTPAEERKAENEAAFRAANEDLDGARREAAGDEPDQLLPCLCECSDARCTEIIALKLREYEGIRAVPTHFLNAPGHDDPSLERIVEQHERYHVSEKFGEAGATFSEADPRSSKPACSA